MDGAALEGLHGVQRDGVARHLDLARGAEGNLLDGVLAPLAVPLDIDDHAPIGP